MIIYEATTDQFLEDVAYNRITQELREKFRIKGLGEARESEISAWKNSLQYMKNLLDVSDVPGDAGVAIELQIPVTSKRIDFFLTGYDSDGTKHGALLELKQWGGESTECVPNKDGIVKTFLGGDVRETTHPSYQAWSYSQFIEDFNANVQREDIQLHPAAYLHNYDESYRNELENEYYEPYVDFAPVYLKQDVEELSTFLDSRIERGDGGAILDEIENSELKPSDKLQDTLLGMLESSDEFTLIDSQKVVFERAVELALKSQEDGRKRVMIVEGGPGTGKTVVAINILSKLIQHDLASQYVSKNKTPRDVYEQKLRGDKLVKEIRNLFKGASSYQNEDKNRFAALIADEAHRLLESGPFYNGESQIYDIINASQFSVFFIDEHQRVHMNDVGSKEEIRSYAESLGAEVYEDEIESQFRCDGSEGYIAWLDDVLGIRDTANATGFDLDYEIKLFDDPHDLHEAIREKDLVTDLSRVVAGYCWDWDKDNSDNPAVKDIEIDDYRKSWNLDGGDPWAIDSGSIDEVGCIHTCQGLEFDYVGVIIGPDLKYRDGEVVTDHEARADTDRSLFGIKKMLRENPGEAYEKIDEIVKNTYRTLMSRGMKGCYVYCVDDQLQEYMRDRIDYMS